MKYKNEYAQISKKNEINKAVRIFFLLVKIGDNEFDIFENIKIKHNIK